MRKDNMVDKMLETLSQREIKEEEKKILHVTIDCKNLDELPKKDIDWMEWEYSFLLAASAPLATSEQAVTPLALLPVVAQV